MSDVATPEGGSLTIDEAVAAYRAPPVEDKTEAQAAPEEAAAEPEGEEIEAEANPAEDPDAEPVEPAEEKEAEAEPEAVAPVEPPKYWQKEAKEAFANLPPELQAVVLAQEGPREEAAAKAKADAAEVRKTADAELTKVTRLSQELGQFLPQALETFQSRWGADPDWVAYATEHGAEAMTLAKAQHEAEIGQLQKLATATQEAETLAHQAFVKAEFAKLAEIAPDLADPDTGSEKRTAVTQYLVKQGIEPDALRRISASEMVLAQKAMLWDQARAALKAKPTPKPAPVPQKAPVRPAAAVSGRSTQQRSLEQLSSRLDKSGDLDDAVRLLQAQRKTG